MNHSKITMAILRTARGASTDDPFKPHHGHPEDTRGASLDEPSKLGLDLQATDLRAMR